LTGATRGALCFSCKADLHSCGKLPKCMAVANQEQKPELRKAEYYDGERFTLYQGDCIAILSQFPENSIDMIFADPPYNLSNGGFSVHSGRRVSVNKGHWDRSSGFDQDYDFHQQWIAACQRVLRADPGSWDSP
jgi:site-specific DNA-methyltransferase (adenine-specific)